MKHTEQHSHPSLKAATWIYTNTYYFSSMWSRLCYTQSCRIAKCTWIYLCANVSQLPLVVSRSHFCWHVFFYSFQKTCLDMNLTARRRSSIQLNSWRKWWKILNLHPLSAEIFTEAAMLTCVCAHPIWSWCRSCLATSQSCYKCLFKSVLLVRASGNLDRHGQAVWSHFMRFLFTF